MRKLKHKIDTAAPAGTELDIELPEGYLTPEEAAEFVPKSHVETIVKSRLAQARKAFRGELLEDEAFRAEAVKAWKLESGTGDGGKPNADAIANAIKEYEKAHVEPLKGEIAKRDSRIANLIRSKLESQLVIAAQGKIRESYLKPLPGTKTAAVVQLFGDAFGFDEESGEFFVRNTRGDGFAHSGDPKAAHPWKTPAQFFDEIRKEKDFADFFVPAGQGGPGIGEPRRAAAGVAEIDASDPLAFGRNAERIVKGDVVVRL